MLTAPAPAVHTPTGCRPVLSLLQARVFAAWCEHVGWRRRSRCNKQLLGRALATRARSQAAACFDGWAAVLQQRKADADAAAKAALQVRACMCCSCWCCCCMQLDAACMSCAHKHMHIPTACTCTHAHPAAQSALDGLRAENERLRRDNERFVRLIDSGEWGRGRVAELVAAGEVLQGERDALLALMASLKGEVAAASVARAGQEDELRAIKQRMMVGVRGTLTRARGRGGESERADMLGACGC